MVSERLKTLFGKVKNGLSEKLSEIKHEDIAKFAVKEAIGVLPVVGPIIKDAFDEFSPDEKEELIKELKELSETQFNEISENVGVSVEYLKDIRKITLYTFEELRADHEEIKKLLLHLIEIQTRERNIPTIQAVLRKGETYEGDFFKKEPEWIDFEEGFVIERREVDEIINKLETDTIQLVLGEPASGKSVILKNIGFKFAKENKDVYIVELKKHSRDEVKRYFEDIFEIKDEKAVFIVDDAHLLPTECERLVRDFKNRKSKAKLIIGSRETREIRGEYPKEGSEFEYLSKTDIHAEDVTEEMIKRFLKRKYGFSDERIKVVSKNLEEYKKDLWHLSWALKAYNPEKDSVEEEGVYDKIRDSIRNISVGKGKPGITAEDVFLPLSIFYRFEIPIERRFLEEHIGIEENIINQLIDLSEVIETEEIGKRRTLSLIHSSIADLYFKTYQLYFDLGGDVKKIFQGDNSDAEYPLFYQYIDSMPMNFFDVVLHLNLFGGKRGQKLFEKLIIDEKLQKSIKESIKKEKNVAKIGFLVWHIVDVSKEVGLKLINLLDNDNLLSEIEKEEDIMMIGTCVWSIFDVSEEVGLRLANHIDIKRLSSKIEKEEDIWNIGFCIGSFAGINKEMGLKLANSININSLSSKIKKEKVIGAIGMCVGGINKANKEVTQEIANRLNPEIKEELQKGGWLK